MVTWLHVFGGEAENHGGKSVREQKCSSHGNRKAEEKMTGKILSQDSLFSAILLVMSLHPIKPSCL